MLFEYFGVDREGQTRSGFLEASDSISLKRNLFERGILTTDIRAMEMKRGDQRLSLSQSAVVARQIALFLKTGSTLDEAFRMMADGWRRRAIQKKLFWIANRLKEGIRLEVILKDTQLFPEFFSRIIGVAEKTGRLIEVLEDLALFCERKEQFRQRWIQALLYPAFLLTVSLGVLTFILGWVFPSFLDLFHDMNRPLPWSTRVVLTLGGWLSSYGWVLLILGVGVIVLLKRFHFFKRSFFKGWFFRMPGFEWVWKKKNACEVSQNLALLMKGGFQIPESFALAGEGAPLLQEALSEFRTHLEEGKDVEAGHMLERILPREFLVILSRAFKSANLIDACEKMGSAYRSELDQFLTRFTTLLGPVLLLLVGTLIGFLAVGVLLPLFEISP